MCIGKKRCHTRVLLFSISVYLFQVLEKLFRLLFILVKTLTFHCIALMKPRLSYGEMEASWQFDLSFSWICSIILVIQVYLNYRSQCILWNCVPRGFLPTITNFLASCDFNGVVSWYKLPLRLLTAHSHCFYHDRYLICHKRLQATLMSEFLVCLFPFTFVAISWWKDANFGLTFARTIVHHY